MLHFNCWISNKIMLVQLLIQNVSPIAHKVLVCLSFSFTVSTEELEILVHMEEMRRKSDNGKLDEPKPTAVTKVVCGGLYRMCKIIRWRKLLWCI